MSERKGNSTVILDNTEATFIHRALSHYLANVVAAKTAAESPEGLEEYRALIKKVGNYQKEKIEMLMHILDVAFTIDTTLLLPDFSDKK